MSEFFQEELPEIFSKFKVVIKSRHRNYDFSPDFRRFFKTDVAQITNIPMISYNNDSKYS